MTIDRRTFLKVAGTQAGLVAAGVHSTSGGLYAQESGARRTGPAIGAGLADVVVIGAGAFGGWTALNLQKMGMRVTLVDALGPGNSRSTSGDETRSCHYELSVGRNFIIDRHPAMDNVWIVGAGSAEGFKFGPVIGDYAAGRIAGADHEPELAAQFTIPKATFDDPPPPPATTTPTVTRRPS